MKKQFDPELEKAVREYYEWQGDRNMHIVRFVENKPSAKRRSEELSKKCEGYRLLLVRFIDEKKRKLSAFMEYTHWADGHWDVTEVDYFYRECEKCFVRAFEKSEEYV